MLSSNESFEKIKHLKWTEWRVCSDEVAFIRNHNYGKKGISIYWEGVELRNVWLHECQGTQLILEDSIKESSSKIRILKL